MADDVQRRFRLHRDAGFFRAGIGEVMDCTGRDADRVTRSGHYAPGAQAEAHPSGNDPEHLLLPGVDMAARHRASRRQVQLPTEARPAIRRQLVDDDSLAARGVFDDSRHRFGCARHSYGHVTMLTLGGPGSSGRERFFQYS